MYKNLVMLMTIYRKHLTLSLFCAGVGFFSIASFAQDVPVSFYPKSPWEIGELEVVSDFSGECAIQTEFNNGFILQMNGSSDWVQLLSLNIRQNAFTANEKYNVSLTVPGIKTEIIESTAFKSNVISIPVKGHKDLYKAIRDSGVLDISIEDNSFRFILTGFTGASKNFEYCMAGSKNPSTEITTAAPTEIETEIEAEANTVKTANIKNPNEELSVSTKDMDDDAKAYLVNEAVDFEAEELQAVEPAAIDTDMPSETVEEIIEETKVVSPPAIEEDHFEYEKNSALPNLTPVADTNNQNDVIGGIAVSNPVLTEIKTPDTIIHKETYTAQADFTTPSNAIQGADTVALAKIAELEAALAQTQQELKTALAEGQQEHFSVESDNWNLERATKRYNEAERQMKRLGQELQKERAQCVVEKKELEMMLFDPKISSQEQLAHLASLEDELREANATIDQLKSQLGM